MMKAETEKKLADHLMNFAIHERIIENERIQLNQVFNFQPNSAFKRVDRYRNFKINAYDLATFLRDNGHNIFSVDLTDLVKVFDIDGDGGLDLVEFSNLFLTATDIVLRKRVRERHDYNVDMKERLSEDIERRMAKILIIEIEGLKELNLEKEILKNRHDFSRLDAFRVLDQYKMNSLIREDFRVFLVKHGIQASSADADNIMRRLDVDKDGRITYSEFAAYLDQLHLNNLKPRSDQLQALYQSLPALNTERQLKLEYGLSPYDTERKSNKQTLHSKNQDEDRIVPVHHYALTSRNIQNHKTLEQMLTVNYKNEIEKNKILFGISLKNTTPLRRISNKKQKNKNQGSSLTKPEKSSTQSKGILSLETTPSPSKESQIKVASQKKLFGRRLNLDDIPEEEKDCTNSQCYNKSSNNPKDSKCNSQQLLQSQNSSQISNTSQRQLYMPPLDLNEQSLLAETFQKMIFLENDIEKSKQQLALRVDFNLLDGFKYFDLQDAGELTRQDIEDGFVRLGVYGLKNEIELFFTRYDISGDGRIKYLEFVDAFTPKDKIYANHLQSKKPNYDAESPELAMSPQTKLELAEVIRGMLKCEVYTDELRTNLNKREHFSINAAFTTIDINENSYITSDELKAFLEEYEFFATQREIQLIFDKFDRDSDGKISFNEFFQELAPKAASEK